MQEEYTAFTEKLKTLKKTSYIKLGSKLKVSNNEKKKKKVISLLSVLMFDILIKL